VTDRAEIATGRPSPPAPDRAMRPTYVRVIVVQAIVLAALWIFQEYFSR
jgi:hypothetical protein